MTIAGFFLANELVGPARRFSFEQFLKIAILGISCAAPLGLALFLDHLEEPAGTKAPDEEVESLLDFLDEPQCAAVCPVDCCVPDEDNEETEEELLIKKERLHL